MTNLVAGYPIHAKEGWVVFYLTLEMGVNLKLRHWRLVKHLKLY